MKFLHYATYNTTPLGIKWGKWSHDRAYGTGGKSGWYVDVTISWLGKRYQFQVRHDNF